MSKILLLSLYIGILPGLTHGLRADTVILKSGEKFEAKVISETEKEITVSVQVTASIKDERVIKKADIERIEKVKPDEVAWAGLAGIEPGPDSLEAEDYQRVIAALEYFQVSYPESTHLPVVKQRLAKFQEEQRRVQEGQMKMDDTWLSRERVQEERIQIGGRILFNRMKRSAASGQLTDAMAVFDMFDKNFSGSADYAKAVALANQILPSLKASAEQGLARAKRRAGENKMRLNNAKGAERTQLEALLAAEKKTADAAIAALEKAGTRWMPLQPATERSMTSLLSRISSESGRLNGVSVEKMEQSLKAVEKARDEIQAHKLASAETALNEAASLWPANEMAQRLKKKLAVAKAQKATEKAAPAK